MRKIKGICWLLILAIAVTLIGCASGGAEGTESSGTGETTAPAEVVMQNPSVSEDSKATEPDETIAPTVENAGGTSESDPASEPNSTEATTGKSAEPTAGSTNSGNTGSTSTGNTGNTSTGNTGSTSSGNTGSTSSGNTGSTSTGNTGSTSSGNTGSTSSGNTGSTSSGNTGSTSSGNTGSTNSGNTGSTSSGNTGSTSSGNTGSTSSGNTGSTSSGNTGSTNSGNTGSTSTGNTGSTSSGNTGSTSTPAATTPKPTDPPATQPTPTEPAPTSPPSHTHSYTETVVAPTCTAQGYTLHTCACGDSYKDSYVDKIPHWMVETERVAATLESEGYVLYTCAYGCGRTETEPIPKLTEYIDTAALEQYGINYGVNTYGCIYSPGLRDGYYPGYQVKITTMEEGYKYVVEEIDCLIANLLGVGAITQQDINNKTVEARIDLGVEKLGDGYFLIRAYYG